MSDKRSPNPVRRDPAVHRAILQATVELLEAEGYKRLSVEAIAARAGVGKQTIYRWWKGKAELVMEAFSAASDERVPEPDTGSIRGDLEAILVPVFKLNADFSKGTALANKSLMAEAQMDREFLRVYSSLVQGWHAPLRRVLLRAKERGELRPSADPDALIDLLLGVGWYRMLLEHRPLTPKFAKQIIQTVLEGSR